MSEPTHGGDALAALFRSLICPVVLGWMVLALISAARAEPIRVHPQRIAVLAARAEERATVSAEALMQRWEPYFARALRTQSTHVLGPNAARLLAVLPMSDPSVAASPMVQYLQWRRGLNVARFTAFHPRLSLMLNQTQIAQTSCDAPSIGTPLTLPPVLAPGGLIPPLPTPIEPTPVAPVPVPPTVPEPGTGLIGLVLVGMAAAHRHRRARRAA